MPRKIKLKKLKSINHDPQTESLKSFVAKNVSVVKVDAILDATEEEVTTLENLRAAKSIMLVDNRAFRSGLQRLDELKGGAAGMNNEEKTYCGTRFAFSNPTDLLTEYPNVRDRINNGMYSFHSPAVKDRESRFEYAASIIYNTVDVVAADTVITKFITPQTGGSIDMYTAYVKFGKEGSDFGDADYFVIDYVNSTGTYLNAGLKEDIQNNMQAAPGNLTVTEVINAINNVLIEGIREIP